MQRDENRKYSFAECEASLSSHKISKERKRIIVIFADLVGFAPWMRRAHSLADFAFIIDRIYRKFIHFKEDLGYHVKLLGDGAMFVKEMGRGHNCEKVLQILRDMKCLSGYVNEVIARAEWPRPGGFRIRLASGYVTKIKARLCDRECSLQHDYIGYPVNLAARMLEIDKKSKPIILHESVKDIIGTAKSKRAGLSFNAIPYPVRSPDGIDEEDLTSFWGYTFEDVKRMGKKAV
jgi:class 3 adenylate cyclase